MSVQDSVEFREDATYASTKHSSLGSKRFNRSVRRTLLGLCIGARYDMLILLFVQMKYAVFVYLEERSSGP